ncbi:MAG: beta-propeller domain-containing protein, partial [Myxococcales bacterium]|nr:beta-propeller domain-containing protein [Myxococcales bacterium]
PLFVIDLADPNAPAVLGELKIPGFSTYMHPMDDDYLLTMGYDAQDMGNFAYFQGLQLQVIDASDLADPLLKFKEVIGTRGSTSEAATNHLAFNYYKTRDQLAVPMTICEESQGGGDYGDVMTFTGLLVYRVTTDQGFTLLGGIPHDEPDPLNTPSGKCFNWWTKSSSRVKRSVFMEDWVFSIAPDRVNVAHIDSLGDLAASIPLIE